MQVRFNRTAFGQLIREKRIQLDLTQGQLAIRMKNAIPQATLSAWESGRQCPVSADNPKIQLLAEALQVKLEELQATLLYSHPTTDESQWIRVGDIDFVRHIIQETGGSMQLFMVTDLLRRRNAHHTEGQDKNRAETATVEDPKKGRVDEKVLCS